MAGIVFLVLFFILGGVLVGFVHAALLREDKRWGSGIYADLPTEPLSPQDRAV